MLALDVIYWASLFLGAAYIVLTLSLGGLSHMVDSVHQAFDIGGDASGLDLGHADASGDFGHADIGHVDVGHSDIGHIAPDVADAGFGDTGSLDTGYGDVGTADAGVGHTVAAGEGISADHAHDIGHDVSHGSHVNLLALLNPTMASSFLIGLGGGGVLSRISGAGALPSLACAGVGGGLFYYYAWWLIVRFFGGAQASSHTRRVEMVGVRATVTAPIEGSKPGMVAFTIAGARQSFRAITYEGDAIPVGAKVRIRRVTKDAVLVTPLEGVLGAPQPIAQLTDSGRPIQGGQERSH